MSYISHSTKNILCNSALPEGNITKVWILIIEIKEPKTVKQAMKDISIQHLKGKCNRIQLITDRIDNKTVITNIQKTDTYSIK